MYGHLNRKQRRKLKYYEPGTQRPIDLGIKQYKREHGNEPKRVLYYKVEMWKAFHQAKEKTHASKSKSKK